ncbi:MAG: nucleotidyltransferase [Verrucomicrobiae bacterium]|nr:nucleotidyltransferase [Verrucomicrobiae bacterium]
MKLNRDLREFVGLLNSHKVEFLVVGAHALAYHGLPRYTKDIDLFVAPRAGNADSMIRAIDEFGFASVGLSASDFLTPDIVVQLGVEPHRLDLLTGLSGISWDEAWSQRIAGTLDGLDVWFLSKDCYIKNKLASGRPQDLADVARLRQIRP